MKTISPAFQMGVRVAVGVAFTVILGLYLRVRYDYWATMTVFLVMCPSWGATIQKGFRRLGMTVLGCFIAGIIYPHVNDSKIVLFICFIISVFLVIYVLKTSYIWGMFYGGFMLVFMYGLLGGWTYSLLYSRIAATAAGCVIAILVSRFIFPASSAFKFSRELPAILKKLNSILEKTVQNILKNEDEEQHLFYNDEISDLFNDYSSLKGEHILASYESLLIRRKGILSKRFISLLDIFTRNLLHLIRLAPEIEKNNYSHFFNETIVLLSNGIDEKLKSLIVFLKDNKLEDTPKYELNAEKLSLLYRNAKNAGASDDDLLVVTAVIYYLRRMNENLRQVIELHSDNKI